MSLKKRLMAVGVIAIAAAITFGIAKSGQQITEKQENTIFTNEKETLYLWYTDEALTSYLSGAAVAYNESHDVRIVPVLESGLEYLESINRASIETNVPDLYILGHDLLEKAYLAGLASEVTPAQGRSAEELYIEAGIQAATYKDKMIGYPFYFETSALLYNRTYLEQMAISQLEAEAVQAAEAAGELTDESIQAAEEEAASQTQTEETQEEQFTKEQIDQRVLELIPSTIEGIKSFADSYDAPEQVEGVFKWDVTDIFYNYFFVGKAMDMGGEAGWDTSRIDIYNLDAIKSMRVYQELNQFFSNDTSVSSYEGILDEFMEGKMVFTMATSDAVAKLEQAKREEAFPYDYGIAPAPDINDEMQTRSLSMTGCVVINGYSGNKQVANDFALYLTTQYNNILYDRTGKVSAAKNVDYENEALNEFAGAYERSISMPKMLETSNFWVRLEAAFSEIWNGADVNEELKALSEQIMRQVTGQEYQEEYIEEEPETQEEEYSDEEYYDEEEADSGQE
ncbi:MAG: extracellular solute-binding protein [Lachnospiraceae bacterium]|nr:extracellular solute-binding protein [Lachnospiraceae bacterium]